MEIKNDNELREYLHQAAKPVPGDGKFVRRVMEQLPPKRKNQSRRVFLLFTAAAVLILMLLSGYTFPRLFRTIPEGFQAYSAFLFTSLLIFGLFILILQQTLQALSDE